MQDVRFLLEDVQALQPTIFCGVPRVFDRICAGKTRMLLMIIFGSVTTMFKPRIMILNNVFKSLSLCDTLSDK